MLQIKNLSFHYQDGENNQRIIFKNTNATFKEGTFYTIIGPSGCGKTTLLSLLGTLDKPQEGIITYNNIDIYKDPEKYRQKNIGFVFQNYNLINYLNAYENVYLAANIAKNKCSKEDILTLLKLVDIDENKTYRLVNKLSGGEQQRVALARALINDPDIILCDEPTGNLDTETSDIIINLLKILTHKFNKCIIMVTHNLDIAKTSDIVYKIEDYQIKEISL